MGSGCRNSCNIYIYLHLYGHTYPEPAPPARPTAQPLALLSWKFRHYGQKRLVKPLDTLPCRFHGISKQRFPCLYHFLFPPIVFLHRDTTKYSQRASPCADLMENPRNQAPTFGLFLVPSQNKMPRWPKQPEFFQLSQGYRPVSPGLFLFISTLCLTRTGGNSPELPAQSLRDTGTTAKINRRDKELQQPALAARNG